MVNWSGLNFVVAQTLDVLVNCCPAADQVLKWNLSYWSPVNGVSFPTLFTKWEIGERDFLSMLSRLPSKLFTLEWPAGPISSQWRTSLMGEKRSSAISWSEVISRSSRHLNLARTSLKAEPVFTRRLSFFFISRTSGWWRLCSWLLYSIKTSTLRICKNCWARGSTPPRRNHPRTTTKATLHLQ